MFYLILYDWFILVLFDKSFSCMSVFSFIINSDKLRPHFTLSAEVVLLNMCGVEGKHMWC